MSDEAKAREAIDRTVVRMREQYILVNEREPSSKVMSKIEAQAREVARGAERGRQERWAPRRK